MRRLIVLSLVLCLLVPSAAMAAEKKGFKVAISNSFITHSWRTQMVNNLQKRLALYEGKGWISEFQIQHAGPDVDLQRSHIQNFIDSEVDILIIDPVSLTALNPVIEDAVDAGIVTVISDEPVTTKAPYVVLPTHDVWMEKLAVYVMDRMGGKGNDRCCFSPLFLLPFSDFTGGSITVHDRHLYIHKHKIIFSRLELFHGNRAVFGYVDMI